MSDAQQLDQSRLVMRRFLESDLERLYALLSETPEVARTPDECSMEALTEQMSWPGHIPERDRWVVADRAAPERLLGYSSVFKPPTTPRADLLGVTHPEARGQGIGSALLRLALADAVALGAQDATFYVNDLDTPVAAWAQRRGFAPVGAFTALAAEGERTFPALVWPTGVTIRAWRDAGDIVTLVEASNRCYAGLWGHNVTTADEWARWLPEMETAGIFFLYSSQGRLIGTVRASRQERDGRPVGVVDAPGVIAEARGDGLYRPLLLHAIAWLAAQGMVDIRIESWGDSPAVLADYQALGFSVARRETLFRRALTSPR